MAVVPLSVDDLDRATQAVRRHAIWLLIGKQRDEHQAALFRDLANRFQAAADLARLPVVPEDRPVVRTGPLPVQVDTFPADHLSRQAIPGVFAELQEEFGTASVGNLDDADPARRDGETAQQHRARMAAARNIKEERKA